MQDLQIFKNEEFGEIRTVTVGSEPYFVGKDVADILGYQNGSRDVNRHTDVEDRTKLMIFDGKQNKETIVINESGLYSLILSSRLKGAKKFKRWVTSEILPTIRKHGAYMTPETIEKVLYNPDTIIQLATTLKEERETNRRLTLENNQQKQIIGELQPKAKYYDEILNNKGLVTITQIAKDYGMSGRAMNDILHDLGVQFKESGQWLLYKKYHNEGYTHSATVDIEHKNGTKSVKMNTKWTQKGRLFLYELLKSNGVLPMIEQEKVS